MSHEIELHLNMISEHLANHAESFKRLAIIIEESLPHAEQPINELMNHWMCAHSEINKEYRAGVDALVKVYKAKGFLGNGVED